MFVRLAHYMSSVVDGVILLPCDGVSLVFLCHHRGVHSS